MWFLTMDDHFNLTFYSTSFLLFRRYIPEAKVIVRERVQGGGGRVREYKEGEGGVQGG